MAHDARPRHSRAPGPVQVVPSAARTRHSAVMRCPACDEENPDRAKFCLNCATPLTAPAEPTAAVRKVVTIVFADMVGSTAIGERLDPEALRRVQARYFDAMAAVIERHGGTVEKYIGDAVMAVFGIPRLHEDDAAARGAGRRRDAGGARRAERRTLERDHGVRLASGSASTPGEVVAGDPTGGQRLVTGDTVNVAARLEQAARPGRGAAGRARPTGSCGTRWTSSPSSRSS